MKYKLAARVIFTDMKGEQHMGRVVDASPDHVTVALDNGGSPIRFEDVELISMHLAKAPRQRSRPVAW